MYLFNFNYRAMAWNKQKIRGNARPRPQFRLTIGFMRCCPSQIFRSIEENYYYCLLAEFEIFLKSFPLVEIFSVGFKSGVIWFCFLKKIAS